MMLPRTPASILPIVTTAAAFVSSVLRLTTVWSADTIAALATIGSTDFQG